jgi:hypothetical protein
LKCGLPMVLNPVKSFYNIRGPACSECTAKFTETKRTLVIPKHDEKCIKCVNKLSRPCNTFLYPFGVILCKKHNVHGLSEHVAEHKPSTRQETQTLIVDFIAQRKRDRFEAKKPQFKRDLAMSKQRARLNVRR